MEISNEEFLRDKDFNQGEGTFGSNLEFDVL